MAHTSASSSPSKADNLILTSYALNPLRAFFMQIRPRKKETGAKPVSFRISMAIQFLYPAQMKKRETSCRYWAYSGYLEAEMASPKVELPRKRRINSKAPMAE